MPKVAYSEEDRARIRKELVEAGLELMSRQGVQHTTVEQIYKKVGIFADFLLFLLFHEGGSDCGGPVPAAAENHRICGAADG